jgi:hypothetical protein
VLKRRVRQEFEKNRHVTNLGVIDVLLLKGRQEFEEVGMNVRIFFVFVTLLFLRQLILVSIVTYAWLFPAFFLCYFLLMF